MNGGEETGDDVLVQMLVLTHLVDLLPLAVRHLFPNTLCRYLLPQLLSTPQLWGLGGGSICDPSMEEGTYSRVGGCDGAS